jgi:hypothetical protein
VIYIGNYLLEGSNTDSYLLENGTDSYLLEANQTSPVDFPPLPKVRQAGGIEVTANLLLTVLAVTSTVVIREPLYHSLPKQPAPFEYRVLNLLTSTLAPPAPSAQMPSTPLDLDAIPANTWRAVEPFRNLLETTLRPTAAVPFLGQDLGAPLRVRPTLPWEPQRNELLTAVPFRPDVFFPSLAGPTTLRWEPIVSLSLYPPPGVAAAPFSPFDYPPLSRVVLTPDYPAANVLTSLYAQTTPFRLSDWPISPSAETLRQEGPAGSNLQLLQLPPPAAPFAPFDYPPLEVLRYSVDVPVTASGIVMQDALPPETPPTQPGGGEYIRYTMRPRNVFVERYIHELEPIDEIVEPETIFLGAVEKTLAQAEAASSPVHQEIGLLSALATLSEAYGQRFESAKAAKTAIEQRKDEIIALDEEEIIAMIMVIAATDDPV